MQSTLFFNYECKESNQCNERQRLMQALSNSYAVLPVFSLQRFH